MASSIQRYPTVTGPAKQWLVSYASCGEAFCKVMSASSAVDIMFMHLLDRYESWSNGDIKNTIHDATGIKDDFKGLSVEQILGLLTDTAMYQLFSYTFTGGEGAQDGDPGKEWETTTIKPLLEATACPQRPRYQNKNFKGLQEELDLSASAWYESEPESESESESESE